MSVANNKFGTMVRFRRLEHSEAVPSAADDVSQSKTRQPAPESSDGASRFGLLASAIAGHAVDVAYGRTGEPAWTDGTTVFVDPGDPPIRQVAALAVQASLIAAGSLDEDVLASLTGRPALARRYLALEGHRALSLQRYLLPPSALGTLRHFMAARTQSPGGSLVVARSREDIDEPPAVFGRIRPGRVKLHRSQVADEESAQQHIARRGGETRPQELIDGDGEEGAIVEMLSNPIGGGGGIGRLLKKMFGEARSSGGGPPGADSPSHWTRRGERVGREAAISRSIASIPDGTASFGTKVGTYPEWDVRLMRYRPNWCTVMQTAPPAATTMPFSTPDSRILRRSLVRLSKDLEHHHRCLQGDEVDIDAAVEACVELAAGSVPDEAVYIGTVRRRPGLSVLVLLDVSGSAGEPGAAGAPVHEHQRTAAAALASALHELGHRVAFYAFRSQGRSAVHVLELKRFDDHLDALVMQRLAGLVPAAYTRLGTAIRHGATILDREAATSRRLLIVLSDGLAYDHGYERAYGEADARRALAEARRRGIAGVCLSVGAATDTEALRRVFGTAAYASVQRPEHLPSVVGPLVQSSLHGAELNRRRYQGRRRAQERRYVERSTA